MLKKPEWIDDVVENIQNEIIRANAAKNAFESKKKMKKATTQDYIEVKQAIDGFYRDVPGAMHSNPIYHMRYQGLAASSWHGRKAIKQMSKTLQKSKGIEVDDLIHYVDMGASIKQEKIRKLQESALALLRKHPHESMVKPENAHLIIQWRAKQLTALIQSLLRDPLDAALPSAEALVKKIDNEQRRVFNVEYDLYINAMKSFNDQKYLAYEKKGDKASYAEFMRVRNAPVENYGVELSEIGRVLVPMWARAQMSTEGLAYAKKLDIDGRFVPNELEKQCQAQMDEARGALSDRAVTGRFGRPQKDVSFRVDRVMELYECRPLKDIKELTVKQALADYDNIVKTEFADGM